MDLFANERQDKIVNLINANGSVTVNELIALFGVSIETIRRDLKALEEQALLCRVHGGAVATKRMHRMSTLRERLTENRTEKREICEAAMKYINENDVIFIDFGSTAVEFAEVLRNSFYALTVVTGSADVFSILSNKTSFRLIMTGGTYFADERVFIGPLAANTLSQLHISKAFIFPSTISDDGVIGIDFDVAFDAWNKIFDITDKVYILADSSKIGQSGLYRGGRLEDCHTLITNADAPKPAIARLAAGGADVVLIGPGDIND